MTNIFKLILLWHVCVIVAGITLAWMFCASIVGSARAWRIAVGFDQLANATFGGDEDETISSRCWRYREEHPYKTLQRVIDWLFGDPEHCRKAYEDERQKHGAC